MYVGLGMTERILGIGYDGLNRMSRIKLDKMDRVRSVGWDRMGWNKTGQEVTLVFVSKVNC